MRKKVCLQCGATFEPKRSDASYCSKKCKSKYSYEKKKHDGNGTNIVQKSIGIAQKTGESVELSGNIDIQKVIDLIHEISIKSDNVLSSIERLEHQNNEHFLKITQFETNILEIKQRNLLEISKRLELSDFMLYNNFINVEYLAQKKSGKQFASHRILSEADIDKSYNTELKLHILNYRYKLEYKLEVLNYDIKLIENKIALKTAMLERNNANIKELYESLRFYQAGVLKYQTLLSA